MASKLYNLQYLIFFLAIVATTASGQIVVIDADTNLPIPQVHVISSKSSTSSISKANGYIDFDVFSSNEYEDTLSFSHLAYEPFSAAKSSFRDLDTVKLHSRQHSLAEVFVNSDKKFEFKNFSSCFRTYQSVNGSVILYSDGTIDYATKLNKEKYLLKRKDYRTFKDTTYFRNRPSYSIDIDAEVITIPRLPEHLLPQKYFSRNNRSIVITGNNGAELREDGIVIGHIKQDSTTLTYLFDGVVKSSERRILGFRLIAMSHMVKLVFKVSDATNADYASMKLDDLIYFSHHSIMKIKHKRDKEYKLLETIQEGFIEGVIETDSIDLGEYTIRSGVGESSSYSSKYWLNCNCELYVPPTDIQYNHLPEGPNLLNFTSSD